MNSETYKNALETVNAATTIFRAAQAAYRSMAIGDAEYLAARKEYEVADAAFEAIAASEIEYAYDLLAGGKV